MEVILAVVFISAIVVAVIFGFFVYNIFQQHRIVMKWQQARIAAEINTLESERKRIAGDLHDELGPMLSAIKLQINHLEPVTLTEEKILQKSSDQIDDVIQRFREISYNLLPNTLVRKGFIKATEEFIGRLKSLQPLNIEFQTDEFSLSPEREVNLYRIIQEITQNTLKHAEATNLQIRLRLNGKMLSVFTKDDGRGFDYNASLKQQSGVGLMSLHSRVELLGGQLTVQSEKGKGSTFQFEISLANDRHFGYQAVDSR